MIPFHCPQIRLPDLFTVPFIRDGQEQLSKKLSEYFSTENVVLLRSARYGIRKALNTLSITEGSEVIIPALICDSVVDAVREAGARPVFCDIEEQGSNMDPAACRELVNEKTVAIIVAHLFGFPARIDEYTSMAREKDLVLIEDCAHAFGGKVGGQLLGTFGDFGVFSFGISKNITATGGGLLICRDANARQSISESISVEGVSGGWRKLLMAGGSKMVFNRHLYRFFRARVAKFGEGGKAQDFNVFEGTMPEIDAGLVLPQLERFEEIRTRRNANAKLLLTGLEGSAHTFDIALDEGSSSLFFPIRGDGSGMRRKQFLEHGLEVNVLGYGEPYRDEKNRDCIRSSCPNMERIMDRYLLLPLGHDKGTTGKYLALIGDPKLRGEGS
jgi:dTDP-4-amino-4,6-dideoxygalactose transaminase